MDIQWPLVFFTVLSGCGGWLIALTAFNEFTGKAKNAKTRERALIIGIILVVAGGCASAMHLSHVDRMMGALSHPTSGIFTEALLVGLVTLFTIIYLVMVKREVAAKTVKVIAVIAAVLGIVLSFAAGASYMMPSRPAWNNILLPLGYLGTAAASGSALYLLMLALGKEEKDAFDAGGQVTMICGIAAAVLGLAYGAVAGGLAGSGAMVLWGGVVLVGGVLPAVCGSLVKKGNSVSTLATVSFIGGIVGSFAFRCFMWIVGTGILTLIGNGNWFSSI